MSTTHDLIKRLTAPKVPATKLGRSLAQLGLREIPVPVVAPEPVAEPVAEPSWPRLTHAEWRAAPGAPSFLHPGWGF